MAHFMDLTGQRYGMLVVIKKCEDYRVYSSGRKTIQWLCKCDCGNYKKVAALHLRNGDIVSCGCYGYKQRKEAVSKPKHGFSRTRIYHLYQNMKYRCQSSTSTVYDDYGGRGIEVCDEWSGKEGFTNFYNWAIKNGYDDKLSIDRIDVNGNYSPDNCRWADTEIQCNNTRKSVKLTYKGKTMTAAQWGRELGLDRHTIYWRIKKGLPIEEVLGPRTRNKTEKNVD